MKSLIVTGAAVILSVLLIAGCGMFYEVYRDTENRFDDRYGEGATKKTFKETVGKSATDNIETALAIDPRDAMYKLMKKVKAEGYESAKQIGEDFHDLLVNYKRQYGDPGLKYVSDIERAAIEINPSVDSYKTAKYKADFVLLLMRNDMHELKEYHMLCIHVLATAHFEQSLWENQRIKVEEPPKS